MNRAQKKATAVRVVLFIILLAIIVTATGKLFIPFNKQDTNQASTYYDTPRNSIDVLTVGASTLMVGVSNLELWKNEGIVGYTLGNSRQAPIITLLNVKEAYEYQNPKVVIIGVKQLFEDYDYDKDEGFVRRGMDFKKLSLQKLVAVADIVDKSEEQIFLSYVFPLFRYHSRWSELEYSDLKQLKREYDYMRGQFPVYRLEKIEEPDYSLTPAEPVKYRESSFDYYKRVAEYCQSKGSEVVFCVFPYKTWTRGRSVTLRKVADELGVGFIDFNDNDLLQKYGIDWEKDFYNSTHLNAAGSVKASKCLGDYLTENYSLPQYECSEELADQLNQDLNRYQAELDEFYRETYPSEM